MKLVDLPVEYILLPSHIWGYLVYSDKCVGYVDENTVIWWQNAS
jgi:hypothetical protein